MPARQGGWGEGKINYPELQLVPLKVISDDLRLILFLLPTGQLMYCTYLLRDLVTALLEVHDGV
jgi:hypothetical protein